MAQAFITRRGGNNYDNLTVKSVGSIRIGAPTSGLISTGKIQFNEPIEPKRVISVVFGISAGSSDPTHLIFTSGYAGDFSTLSDTTAYFDIKVDNITETEMNITLTDHMTGEDSFYVTAYCYII
jgi:hypothetical protein